MLIKKLIKILLARKSFIILNINTIFNNKIGINDSFKNDKEKIIVSLTSYPLRFRYLHICLETLLEQSLKPDRLILWIAEDDFNKIHRRILSFQNRGLEIKKCPDLKSYKKIYYILEENRNNVIVTADDDIIYPRDWLETLYRAYLSDKETIQCHRARLITFNEKGELNPYRYWPNVQEEMKSKNIIPIGCGGVLYPPGSFDDRVFDKETFLKLCPYGDDIWLKVMTLLNNKMCHKLNKYKEHFMTIPGTQKTNLWEHNKFISNDLQIKAVFDWFNITKDIFI